MPVKTLLQTFEITSDEVLIQCPILCERMTVNHFITTMPWKIIGPVQPALGSTGGLGRLDTYPLLLFTKRRSPEPVVEMLAEGGQWELCASPLTECMKPDLYRKAARACISGPQDVSRMGRRWDERRWTILYKASLARRRVWRDVSHLLTRMHRP
ncbi:hypothetical protein NPIL_267722 [Nephila pilipes]|uniref:Uncharacterized protein n=1 Tax=Nephila pilipes TaxID=299642 RepID=A0A8X6MQ08_NEPPI|nr:hypothetical protein NPIL_267722 [Nephila pilipes]